MSKTIATQFTSTIYHNQPKDFSEKKLPFIAQESLAIPDR